MTKKSGIKAKIKKLVETMSNQVNDLIMGHKLQPIPVLVVKPRKRQ
jgi:hypothetical protein